MPILNLSPRQSALGAGLILWAVLSALAAPPLAAQTEIPREYQIKAAFLFNFAQFVQWPADSFATADEPFRIGVLGQDPFGDFLEETVSGEKIDGHPLIIEHYTKPGDAQDCRILFISRSESGQFVSVLAGLKGKGILTVGDTDGFLADGGMVRFVTEENKIHFKIDLDAVKSDGLVISSQVLRLAKIVKPGED